MPKKIGHFEMGVEKDREKIDILPCKLNFTCSENWTGTDRQRNRPKITNCHFELLFFYVWWHIQWNVQYGGNAQHWRVSCHSYLSIMFRHHPLRLSNGWTSPVIFSCSYRFLGGYLRLQRRHFAVYIHSYANPLIPNLQDRLLEAKICMLAVGDIVDV